MLVCGLTLFVFLRKGKKCLINRDTIGESNEQLTHI